MTDHSVEQNTVAMKEEYNRISKNLFTNVVLTFPFRDCYSCGHCSQENIHRSILGLLLRSLGKVNLEQGRF